MKHYTPLAGDTLGTGECTSGEKNVCQQGLRDASYLNEEFKIHVLCPSLFPADHSRLNEQSEWGVGRTLPSPLGFIRLATAKLWG